MTAIRIAAPRFLSARPSRRTTGLFAALFCSDVSGWLQMLVTTWLLWNGPRPEIWLTLFMVARSAPKLLASPFAGAVADRVERLRLYRTCRVLAVFPPLGLAAAAAGIAPHQQITIVLVAAAGAVLASFDQPARRGLLWDVGGPGRVVGAVSLGSAAFHSASSLAPALAVVLSFTLGTTGALLAAALISCGSLLAIRDVERQGGVATRRENGEAAPNPLGGLHYLRRTPSVLALLVLSTAPGLLSRAVAIIIPAVASSHAHESVAGTGALASAPGTGAFVAAVVLSIVGEVADKSRFASISAVVFVASMVAANTSLSHETNVLFLGLAGASSATFGAMIFSMLHLRVPDHLRCRVMAL